MTRNHNVPTRVTKIIASELGVDVERVLPHSSFVTDLGADSLDLASLALRLEDEFQCEIDDSYWQEFKTPHDVVLFVETEIEQGRAA